MGYTARDVLWPQGYRGKNLEPGAFLAEKLRVDPTLALAARVELYVVNQLPDAWIVYFPFPFLLLLTLLLWLSALAWRARRMRRLESALAMEA
jgi:hypothetical protein